MVVVYSSIRPSMPLSMILFYSSQYFVYLIYIECSHYQEYEPNPIDYGQLVPFFHFLWYLEFLRHILIVGHNLIVCHNQQCPFVWKRRKGRVRWSSLVIIFVRFFMRVTIYFISSYAINIYYVWDQLSIKLKHSELLWCKWEHWSVCCTC